MVTPNIGIVASLDILAADQASVDLIYALKPEDGHDLVERMETRHGLRQLSYMKDLGMGNDRTTLIDIDHDDAPILPAQADEGRNALRAGWAGSNSDGKKPPRAIRHGVIFLPLT